MQRSLTNAINVMVRLGIEKIVKKVSVVAPKEM
jgi:hypothetical protein